MSETHHSDDSADLESLIDDDADVPDAAIAFDVWRGDSFGEDGEVDRTQISRREAWVEGLVGDDTVSNTVRCVWPRAADRLDGFGLDLEDSEELVQLTIPGWFANLDDNENVARTLRSAAGFDGYDGSKPTVWAVRDTDQDEGKGAFCITQVFDSGRGHWQNPSGRYGMLWPARSCVECITVTANGEPTAFDHEPVREIDAETHTAGEEITEEHVHQMLAAARRRAKRKAQGVASTAFAEALDRMGANDNELLAEKVGAAMNQFSKSMTEFEDREPSAEELGAMAEALEAFVEQ
jgi:hypothetical protein